MLHSGCDSSHISAYKDKHMSSAFGILCNIAGLELGNLWAFSDLGNILIVFFNVPIVYVGAKYVFRATRHYKKNDGTPFTSEVIGRNDCAYWDEQAKKQ